ncbi:MAG: hypothetical protein ACXQS8_00375 [Candidatus Helarchaeales archaeon]
MIPGRKTIAVDKDLADRLAQLAKEEGKTIFSIINELIKNELEATELFKESCSEIIKKHQELMLARDIGLCLMPRSVSNAVYAVAFKDGYDQAILNEYKKWGEWLGTYLKTRFPGKEIEALYGILNVIYWKDANLELDLHPEGDPEPKRVIIRIFGSAVKEEFSSCISVTCEQIFKTLGYKLVEQDILKGICKLEFQK